MRAIACLALVRAGGSGATSPAAAWSITWPGRFVSTFSRSFLCFLRAAAATFLRWADADLAGVSADAACAGAADDAASAGADDAALERAAEDACLRDFANDTSAVPSATSAGTTSQVRMR